MHGLGIENEIIILSSKSTDKSRLAGANSGSAQVAMAMPDAVMARVVDYLSKMDPKLPMDVQTDYAGRACIELITREWQDRKLHEHIDDILQMKIKLVEALNNVVLPRVLRDTVNLEKTLSRRPQPAVSRTVDALRRYFATGTARLAEDGAQVLFPDASARKKDVRFEILHAGSYHINITLPHSRKISTRLFRSMHLKAAMALQWLEPLLVSVLGCPNPLAPLSQRHETALSLRLQNDAYAIVLSTDIAANDIQSSRTNFSGFLSTPDFELSEDYFTNLFRQYNEHLPLWMQMLLRPEFKHKRTPAHDKMMKKGSYHGYLEFGYDFRRNASKGTRFGFEFRVLDNFSSYALHDVVRMMLYVFDHALTHFPDDVNERTEYNAFHSVGANTYVFDAVSTGWATAASPDYLTSLSRVFDVKFPRAPRGGWTGPAVLAMLANHLYLSHHGKGICSSKMLEPTMYAGPPNVPNVNRDFWEAAFSARFPDVAKYLRETDDKITAKNLHTRFPRLPQKAFEADLKMLLAYARKT